MTYKFEWNDLRALSTDYINGDDNLEFYFHPKTYQMLYSCTQAPIKK